MQTCNKWSQFLILSHDCFHLENINTMEKNQKLTQDSIKIVMNTPRVGLFEIFLNFFKWKIWSKCWLA